MKRDSEQEVNDDNTTDDNEMETIPYIIFMFSICTGLYFIKDVHVGLG